MVRSGKMILGRTAEMSAWLSEATAIYNQALYYLRQEFFSAEKKGRKPDYSGIDLYRLVKESDAWKASTLDANAKSYVLRNVKDNWTAFYRACKSYWKDKTKFTGRPRIPGYMKNGRTAVLTFDKSRLRHKDLEANTLTLPKSKWTIKIPDYIEIPKIRCIKVKSFYGKVKLTISYERETKCHGLDKGKWLGVDIGVDNIAAITTDGQTGKSWIVKGGCVKSINQFYNKRLSKMRAKLETVNGKKTSKAVQRLHMKRSNRLDYEFHCISKAIVGLCVENGIGNVVVGHNPGWKQGCDMGRRTNQTFVQIPFNELISKLRYKCEDNGISFMETEEGYTSKTDHSSCESMERHDTYLGRRISRGLFRTAGGKLLNADVNGAVGILRKANAFPDAECIGLRDRGDVVSPLVLKYKP